MKRSILIQRNHSIKYRCVRQISKEAHPVCLTSELLAVAVGHHLLRERYTKESAGVFETIDNH